MRVDCDVCGAKQLRTLPDGRLPFHYSVAPGIGRACNGTPENAETQEAPK
jgi:hypothetical protein